MGEGRSGAGRAHGSCDVASPWGAGVSAPEGALLAPDDPEPTAVQVKRSAAPHTGVSANRPALDPGSGCRPRPVHFGLTAWSVTLDPTPGDRLIRRHLGRVCSGDLEAGGQGKRSSWRCDRALGG